MGLGKMGGRMGLEGGEGEEAVVKMHCIRE